MSTAKEAMTQRDTILDEYEGKLGLGPFESPGANDELEQYLKMDRTVLESMNIDDCGNIAFRLAQFSFHIQRAQNREIARVTWAKNEIRMTIANELQQQKGYGYEEKACQAIKANDHAHKVNIILVYAQQRADRLSFLATGIKNLSDILKSIQINKRQHNG